MNRLRAFFVFFILLCLTGCYGITHFALTDHSATIEVGKSKQLSLEYYADSVFPRTEYWTSTDPTIAYVTQQGYVYGFKIGAATVTAHSNQIDWSDSCLVSVVKPIRVLADPLFNGRFIYSYYWIADDGIDEINEYLELDFNGTSKFEYWFKFKDYFRTSGWHTSPGFGTEFYHFTLELELEHNTYKSRLWSTDDGGDWSSQGTYAFLDSDTLMINNLYGGNYVLTKF